MSQLFSKSDRRAISAMIALIILLGSLSVTTGLAIVSGPDHPELTVNICQPLQASCVATMTLLARPAPAAPELVLCKSGSILIKVLARPSADPSAPDTPPPRQLA